MRKMWVVLAVLAAVPAFAQQDKGPKKQPKTQVVIFGNEDDIIGERLLSSDMLIEAYQPPKFDRLIKVRTNFNDKLMQSVNEL